MEKNQQNSLKFKFDISTYRLLGRELITDRITALFELVKNSYDANAENVFVEFIDVNPLNSHSKIIIKDDGLGMSFEDIRDKWMVIGTSNKRRKGESPSPYFRKVVGKKGVGRFAVDKLGAKLLLKTKKENASDVLCLETDWSFYAQEETDQLELNFNNQNKLFTDVENKYWYEKDENFSNGTTLEILLINDIWSEKDICRASKELSKLILPTYIQKHPFNVVLKAPQYEGYKQKKLENQAIEEATIKIELGYDIENNLQEVLSVDNKELTQKFVKKRDCGLVGFTLYYFDQKAKLKFNKLSDDRIDGVKIYRDGLIATPFAEYLDNRDEQKDLFGIDKRRWSGFFDKLGSRDLIGWIDISESRNPTIIDATNRQNFVDNDAWKELKLFVIEQISKLEEYNKKKKSVERNLSASEFKSASAGIGVIKQDIKELIKSTASKENKKQLEEVVKKLTKTQMSVKKSQNEYQKMEQEKKQQENLFFSLVSLQTYAGMLSHITRTSIGRIKRQVEYITNRISSQEEKHKINCQKYGKSVFQEMNNLDCAVDFMLKYAGDDSNFIKFNVKETIEHIFENIYADKFAEQGIKTLLEINKDLMIRYNHKSFEDIFDNLISNSFKALNNNIDGKIIKCSAIVEKDKLVIYFSDNGCGVDEENKQRVFDVFYTTTSEQGGAGLGLFIVKSRLEAIHGSIDIIDNELKPTGTTFRIVLPFKK